MSKVEVWDRLTVLTVTQSHPSSVDYAIAWSPYSRSLLVACLWKYCLLYVLLFMHTVWYEWEKRWVKDSEPKARLGGWGARPAHPTHRLVRITWSLNTHSMFVVRIEQYCLLFMLLSINTDSYHCENRSREWVRGRAGWVCDCEQMGAHSRRCMLDLGCLSFHSYCVKWNKLLNIFIVVLHTPISERKSEVWDWSDIGLTPRLPIVA